MALLPSTLNVWGAAPDPEIRNVKHRMETELLQLQANRTNEIEFNPLLLSNRLERCRPHASLNYTRVHPPLKEMPSSAVQEGLHESMPLRQLSHPSRRGPRDVILPNLIKQPVQLKLYPVPLTDTMYQKRRSEANERLTQLLADWAVYHRIAHPVPLSRQSMLNDVDPKRKISRGTFIHIAKGSAKGSARRKMSMASQLSSNSGKKSTSFAVPKSLKKRNLWKFFTKETLKHLMAARMILPEEISKSELRMYVSSTPDLQEEREFLEEVAYPKIRELCEHKGLTCHIVDMRTGAGMLTNDIETFDLIEEELRACRTQSIGPSFISLIGHELDDKKLPGFLHKSVFEEIREVLIKENILGVEALDDVYRLDSNRVPPVYIKHQIKAVDEYQSLEDVERVLQEALLGAVALIKKNKPRDELGSMDIYKWSSVVKEVEVGLLTNHSPRFDTLCLLLDPDVTDEVPGEDPIQRLRHNVVTHYRQYASLDNLIHLKSAKKNMTYLRYISDTFVSGVTSLLKSQARFREYDLTQELTEGAETLQHVQLFVNAANITLENQLGIINPSHSAELRNNDVSFVVAGREKSEHLNGEPNAKNSDDHNETLPVHEKPVSLDKEPNGSIELIERESTNSLSLVSDKNSTVFEDIRQVLERLDPSPKTILIWGSNGSGKSSLVALVAMASTQWQPKRKVVARRLGSTLRSSCLLRVLESLIQQLNFLYSLNLVLSIDITLLEMVRIFCQTLRDVSAKRFTDGDLLLILDQVECCSQLSPHIMTSILDSMTEGVTLMLVLNVPSRLFDAVKSHPTTQSFTRPYLSFAEFDKFLTRSLDGVHRVITSDQQAAGQNALPGDITPICSQTVFHIVRWWPSHTLPNLKSLLGEPDLDFDVFIECLESQLGEPFTRYSLCLLASARHGLADHELLHLLSKDSELLSEIKTEEDETVSVVEGFPYQLQLSRLMARLNQFILSVKIEGENVRILSTNDLAKAVKARYMTGEFSHNIHQKLANFFLFIRRGLLLSSRDIVDKKHKHLSKYHWRTMRCVPYHLTHSFADPQDVWKNLKEKVFFNFNWLVNQVYSGFFTELLDDISYALSTVSLDPEIMTLQQLLLSVRHTVIYNPVSLAAFFSSLETTKGDNDKDFIDTLICEARLWLQQVHTQALVPVSYTPGKCQRLLLKEKCLYGITDIHIIPGSEHLLVLRQNTLTILNTLTGEESLLAAFSSKILAFKVIDEAHVAVLTSDKYGAFVLEMFHLDKGKHKVSISLGDSPVLWFHVAGTRTAYFATEDGVKAVDIENGSLKNILSLNISWRALCMSGNGSEKLILLKDGGLLEIIAAKGASDSKSSSLTTENMNTNCPPLTSTKDGLYVIYITDRQATVVKCINAKVVHSFSYHGLPIIKAELSRSHEHLFLAYASGDVTCHVLYSGKQVLETKVTSSQKTQAKRELSRRHTRSEHGKNPLGNAVAETITFLVTSEDDHFLFCGTTLGQVHVIHVPTGLHVINISTKQTAIVHMTFLTDRTHFQHLITTDKSTVSKQWNLRPLFRQARQLLHQFISDDDLRKEEENKIELNNYIHIYQDNVTNRIFLNGPDITAFYVQPPQNLFAPLAELDPDFGQQNDWEISGTLADVTDAIMVMALGHQLSDLLLTISTDFRLARWSLHDGTLVWSRKIGAQGSDLRNLVSVYYDQAALIVEASRLGRGFSLSVIYTGESQNKIMSRDNIAYYWLSADRTHVIMLSPGSERNTSQSLTDMKLYEWDLINSIESRRHLMNPPSFTDDTNLFLLCSPHLTQCVIVCMPAHIRKCGGNVCILKSPNDITDPKSSVESLDTEEETEMERVDDLFEPEVAGDASAELRQTMHDIKYVCPEPFNAIEHGLIFWTRLTQNDKKSYVNTSPWARDTKKSLPVVDEMDINTEVVCSEIILSFRVTSFCFVGEESVFIGTASGHVLLLDLPHLQHFYVLTKTGPKSADGVTEKVLKDFITPHRHWVQSTRVSDDTNTLISQDSATVCVWNIRNKSLVMTIEIGLQEKISHLIMSRDTAIIALVADHQTLHLYTPLEKREIANYRTTFRIDSLSMTCDCRKILARGGSGAGPGRKPVLEIFDVKNVDDILMHIAGRKASQQNGVRESLTNERTRKTS